VSGRTGVSVIIAATDAASAKIDAINKKLASMQAPVDRVQKSLARFADLSGINKIGRGLESVAGAAWSAFQALGRIVAPLGAITGAASIAGMAALVTRWGEFGTRLSAAATRAGLSATQLHTLQNSARLLGASTEDVTSGMTTLGDTITNAIGGRAPQAWSYMRQLGISFQNANGSAKSAAEVLPSVADGLLRIQNPTLRARVGTELLGGAYERLAPWLNRGATGIEELNRLSVHYGVTTEAGVQQAKALEFAHMRLNLAVEGFTNTLSEKLGPILTPLLTDMAEWIAKNRQWIATGINEKVEQFAGYLRGIDWAETKKGVEDFFTGVNEVVTALGGWKAVAIEIFALWTLSKVAPMIAAVGAVSTAFLGANGSALLLKATLAGLIADQALRLIDPQDKTGSWIDQNVPGAGWVDDWFARHTGLGRTFEEQRRVNPGADPAMNWWNRPAGHAGGGGRPQGAGPRLPGPRADAGGTSGGMRNPSAPTAGLVRIDAPGGARFTVGTEAAPHFQALINDMEKAGYKLDPATSGGYNPRMIAGTNTPSLHASGNAVDLNWQRNQRGADRPSDIPPELARALAAKHGLTWGGDWKGQTRDPMHFEYHERGAAGPRVPLSREETEGRPRGFYGPGSPLSIGGGTGRAPANDISVHGAANLNIKVNAPPGTQVAANTTGDIFSGAPRIETSTVGRNLGAA
jgi:hypothetical protein